MRQYLLSPIKPILALVCTLTFAMPASAEHPITAEQAQANYEATKAKVAAALPAVDKVVNAGPFQPQWESLEKYEIPKWYEDAKFGIFIHWGVYSVPAFGSEWYPRNMYIEAEGWNGKVFRHHTEKYGDRKKFGYKDFIPQFKAEKYDPSAWAKLFKETGARYVVPVAEHHDGFPLYDCSFTEWDATQMGPQRDLIGDLEKAVRAEGLKFGVSSHRAFNWNYYVRNENFDNADPRFAGVYGRPLPFLFEKDAANYRENWPPQDQEFKDNWLARTSELVEKYNPDLIWFDFGIAHDREKTYDQNEFAPHLKRFASFYYNHASAQGRTPILNYKWTAFPEKAAVLDLERNKMAEIRTPFWQTDTAVSNSSWGYTENQKYKTAGRLVDDLVDIVAKNGCLLLNVGPRPDGTIPEEDQAILKEIGKWLKVNGEAIYETRYWKTFGEGPTGTATGHLAESKDKPFTAEDIRFTQKDGTLYCIAMDWPSDGKLTVKTLKAGGEHMPGEITGIQLLGSDAAISHSRDDKGLHIQLPQSKPCDHAFVFKVSS